MLHYTHIQMSNYYVVVVCHLCHTLHLITTLSSLSLLYITHHSACFTCYMYVHIHHANVCSILHMLTVCLDHALSLHTCTVLVYHTYMYTHSIQCLSVVHHVPLFVRCHKTKKWLLGCKRFACTQWRVATRDERCFNGYQLTIEVVLVTLKSKLKVKMSATNLPSCVTMKT